MDIYNLLITKKHNPHYLTRYWKFITYCARTEDSESKKFNHHILPKAKDLFPEYKSFKVYPWNKIVLTARQHFLAHWMLWKAYGGSQTKAFRFMNKNTKNLTSKVHLVLLEEFALVNKNKEITSEQRKAASEIMIKRWENPEYRENFIEKRKGWKLSEEHYNAFVFSNLGKLFSSDTIEKMKESASLSWTTERRKQQRNNALKQWNTACSIDDIIYESLSSASNILNIHLSTLRNRCKSKGYPSYFMLKD